MFVTATLVVGELPKLYVIVLVVLVYAPAAAFAGIRTETSKVQLSPDAKLTFEMESVDEPVADEPTPQKLSAGNCDMANPDNVALKSVVNASSEIALSRLLFNIVKVSGTEPPGKADAGKKAFKNVGATTSVALSALTD